MRAITTHQYLWETVPLLFLLCFFSLNFFLSFLAAAPDHRPPLPAFSSRKIAHRVCLTCVFLSHWYRYCVLKLTERLKREGIDINLRDALGVDTDPKLRNLRGKL